MTQGAAALDSFNNNRKLIRKRPFLNNSKEFSKEAYKKSKISRLNQTEQNRKWEKIEKVRIEKVIFLYGVAFIAALLTCVFAYLLFF